MRRSRMIISVHPKGDVKEGKLRRWYHSSVLGRFLSALSTIHLRSSYGSQASDEPATVPSLPLLDHVTSLEPAEWIRTSLTTFAGDVSSFLPGHFEAYARVYHPFDSTDRLFTWREALAIAGHETVDAIDAEDFAYNGVPNAQARVGSLARPLIEALLPHLRRATTTPDECYFAIWEGGGSAVPESLTPKLELPHRAYHVFSGPLDAALTSFDDMQFRYPDWPHHMSANLWWPRDHSWCVATEIDFAWTYVGASRACIDAILADPLIESVEVTAQSSW